MNNVKEWAKSKTTEDILWNSDKESLLREIRLILSDCLKGSRFYLERNSTPGEKSIDIFLSGEKKRIGSIWPKNRKKCIDLLLSNEYVDLLRLKIELPTDKDVKPGRVLNFRKFEAITVEKTIEIIDCLAKI